jgi:hypothetical protein
VSRANQNKKGKKGLESLTFVVWLVLSKDFKEEAVNVHKIYGRSCGYPPLRLIFA